MRSRLDVRPRLPALGPGRGGQLRDPSLVAALAFGRLGLQPRLGLLQASQAAAGVDQLGRELIPVGLAMEAVLALVGLGRLPQDRCDILLELGQGAVGSVSGVGGHLGAVQRDHPQADQPAAAHSFKDWTRNPASACSWRARNRAMVTWSPRRKL
jgi:hypothetical protein